MKIALLILLGAAACAGDIHPEGGPDAGQSTTGKITSTQRADGSRSITVDAQSSEAWSYLDLDSGTETAADGGWDLAFQRFNIRLGAELQVSEAAGWDTLAQAPAEGWRGDAGEALAFDGDGDGDGIGDDPWYGYDVMTHILTPRDAVYVVETSEGAYVKVQVQSYYDNAGTSGIFALRSLAVEAPVRP